MLRSGREITATLNMLTVFLIAFQLACTQQTTAGLKVVVAFSNADVSLPCEHLPFIPNATYTLELTKGKDKGNVVCSGYWTPDNITLHLSSRDSKPCETRSSINVTSFHLTKLDVHDTGYYTCRMEIFRPPPYETKTLREMYLYVHDKELQKCESVPFLLYWVLIGVAVALLVCPIIIIAMCRKKKSRKGVPALPEPNSEYMPMAAVAAAKNNGNEKRLNIPSWSPESVDAKCNGVPGKHIHNKFYDSA